MSSNISLNIAELMMNNEVVSVLSILTDKRFAVAFLTVLICVLGLIGNGTVLWLLFFCLNKTQTTIYNLSLAVADAIYLLGCFIFSLYLICSVEGGVRKTFLKMAIFLNDLGFNCTLFLLVALSTERCVAVCFPIWYRFKRPKHLSSVTCGVMWVLTLLISTLDIFLYSKNELFVYITTISYIIVSLMIILSSIVLVIEIRKRSKACRPKKLYIVIVATVVSFFVSLALVKVVNLLYFFKIINVKSNWRRLNFLTSLFSAINSCANPYIYMIVGSWGKKSSIKEALERVFKEELGN